MRRQKAIRKITALKSGWSRWQMPIMRGYRMACCDCNLVHEVEFEVAKINRKRSNGYIELSILNPEKHRVRLRMKREEP
jgi:hypothetical protein